MYLVFPPKIDENAVSMRKRIVLRIDTKNMHNSNLAILRNIAQSPRKRLYTGFYTPLAYRLYAVSSSRSRWEKTGNSADVPPMPTSQAMLPLIPTSKRKREVIPERNITKCLVCFCLGRFRLLEHKFRSFQPGYSALFRICHNCLYNFQRRPPICF